MAAIIFTVIGQAIDTIHVKLWLVHAIGLVMEVLAHTLGTREHGFNDFLLGVIELFVLELDQDDGNTALSQCRNIGSSIVANRIQVAFLCRQLVRRELH